MHRTHFSGLIFGMSNESGTKMKNKEAQYLHSLHKNTEIAKSACEQK